MRPRTLLLIGLAGALAYTAVPSAVYAQQVKEICDNGIDDDGDKAVDCEDSDCSGDPACKEPPPEVKAVCHNIGGPDAKGGGANCDPDTDDPCCIETEEIGELCIDSTQYFGIVISNSDKSIDAHIKHGDGEATTIFDPPLHLASDGQNHLGANVECVADRVNEQPDEPGN
jgi:hypothetical protein